MSQELPAEAHVLARVGDRRGWSGGGGRMGEGWGHPRPGPPAHTSAHTHGPTHSKVTEPHPCSPGTKAHTASEAQDSLNVSQTRSDTGASHCLFIGNPNTPAASASLSNHSYQHPAAHAGLAPTHTCPRAAPGLGSRQRSGLGTPLCTPHCPEDPHRADPGPQVVMNFQLWGKNRHPLSSP